MSISNGDRYGFIHLMYMCCMRLGSLEVMRFICSNQEIKEDKTAADTCKCTPYGH